MKAKEYEKELRRLHVELVELEEWVRQGRLKVVRRLRGRDGAGKGGTIKAITERVSPRVFRVVALPAPTEREDRVREHGAELWLAALNPEVRRVVERAPRARPGDRPGADVLQPGGRGRPLPRAVRRGRGPPDPAPPRETSPGASGRRPRPGRLPMSSSARA
jgi:hypothetical protein